MFPLHRFGSFLALLICLGCGTEGLHAQPVKQEATRVLASAGVPHYVIVLPDEVTPVDQYAVKWLVQSLADATGAAFNVVSAGDLTAGTPAIFVGTSRPLRQRMARENRTLPELADQQHLNFTMGDDLVLLGQGVHGNLHAVVMFIEQSLQRQWYSAFEKPTIPRMDTLAVGDLDRRRGFSFTHRSHMLRYYEDFNYQHGKNMLFRRQVVSTESGFRVESSGPYINEQPNDIFTHSINLYIQPKPGPTNVKNLDWGSYVSSLDWLDRKNYFATNPEYFSLNAQGKRVADMQLCFSNPQLRAELTRHIIRHIELVGQNNIITVDAADNPDAFCYCDGCKKLESQYNSPGGPLYHYLLELCAKLDREYPQVLVKTLAYRRSQTQIPPSADALPGGRLPANLIVNFAPIEDNYFADWDHPDPRIQETLAHLRGWQKVTDRLWAWIYPNPWGSGSYMPIGNIRRIAINLRHMHDAGVRGVFSDHNGHLTRSGWAELQSYVLHRLMQDIDSDLDTIVRDFTDFHYGSAGKLMRQYLDDLEQHRQAMTTLSPHVAYKSRGFDDRTFPYLTPTNIHRWQLLFDEMTKMTAGEPEAQRNVLQARRELEFATLSRWFDLQKFAPDYFTDATVHKQRIETVNARTPTPSGNTVLPLGKSVLDEFMMVIDAGGQHKPLPSEFAKLDANDIHELMPVNHARSGVKTVADRDAAFGYAVTVDMPDMPLNVGFHQWTSRQPPAGVEGARIQINAAAITPGTYQLHRLGHIKVTPDSWIWFSAKSWMTHLQLGDRVFEPGESNEWVAYVSMKCDGPAYGGQATENIVLVDRIILVAASAVKDDKPQADKTQQPPTRSSWKPVSPNLLDARDAEPEAAVTHWSGLIERTTNDAHAGRAAYQMSRNGAIAMSTQSIPIDPQKTYRLSGWMRSLDPDHLVRGLIDLRQFDAQGNELLPWTVRPITSQGKLRSPAAKGEMELSLHMTDWSIDQLIPQTSLLAVELIAQPDTLKLPAQHAIRLSKITATDSGITLKLNMPLEQEWPAQTPVRIHRYVDHPRTYGSPVPATWTHFSVIIHPLPEDGSAATNTLWPGVASARVAILCQTNNSDKAALLVDDLELVEVTRDVRDSQASDSTHHAASPVVAKSDHSAGKHVNTPTRLEAIIVEQALQVRWIVESILCEPDASTGAAIEQLTSEPIISTNVYGEQRFSSADGTRIVLERRLFGQQPEVWVADLPRRRVARLIKGRPLAANAPLNAIYVLDEEQATLQRINLMKLTVSQIMQFDKDRLPQVLTVSPDEKWLVCGPYPVGDNRFAIDRIDLATRTTTTLAQVQDAFNPHLQFDLASSEQLMIQINRRGTLHDAPDGQPLGATLAIMNVQDGKITPLPVGVPYTRPISGHETWVGLTGQLMFTVAPTDHPTLIGQTGVYLVKPGEDRARPVALGRPVNHLAVSDDGRYFVVDEIVTYRLWIGSVATGKMAMLCDSHTRQGRPQYTHAHPYMTPDNQHVIFNSNVTGVPQVYSARIPEGFLEALD